jgi:hypothetical protein
MAGHHDTKNPQTLIALEDIYENFWKPEDHKERNWQTHNRT